jgi:hypothetical protein
VQAEGSVAGLPVMVEQVKVEGMALLQVTQVMGKERVGVEHHLYLTQQRTGWSSRL